MEISSIKFLRGPNIWSRHTAILALVQCSVEEMDIAKLPDFEKNLRIRFSHLRPLQSFQHQIISMAHVLELVVLDLQVTAGCSVSFSLSKSTRDEQLFQVVVEYSQEPVGALALEMAQQLCMAALNDAPFELDKALHQLRVMDEEVRLGPSTASIVDAAAAQNIPVSRMTEGSMVRLGWGVSQRRIRAAETDQTSAIAEAIAQDKELTKQLLHAAFVPVPLGKSVTSLEQAQQAAIDLGFPVVVKPLDGNQGKGVTVNISSHEVLANAYQSACEYGGEILIEKFIQGNDFRLLVIGDRLIAAARRDPAKVIGNGVNSIIELVDQINLDPRRSDGHATSLTKIRFDGIAMACLTEQGYSKDSIPVTGEKVFLRKNANLSTGGTATDVTDDVHPSIADQAITAAAMVGLDIAGIDLVCEDVMHSIEEQWGGIVEVNAAPGLRMHTAPSYGKPREVGAAIISTLFSKEDDGRIPIVAVSGTNGKTTTARLTTHLLASSGLLVGTTGTDGIFVGDQIIDTGDCSGPKSAKKILWHPEVQAAVLEVARGGILREGLAFDECDVSIVTNIGSGDHLGLNHIHTLEELAAVKRVVIQNTKKSGAAVLNAQDPLVAKMANHAPCEVIFFAKNGKLPIMAAHKVQGKPVVYLEKQQLVLQKGQWREDFALADIAFSLGGKVGFQVENAMAALGAAWKLGVSPEIMRLGLKTFDSQAHNAGGRFNVFNYKCGLIVADYGHNVDAIEALVDSLGSFSAKRRWAVISGAGDRRDEDIIGQSKLLGAAFDEVVLFEDKCQRGRHDGEVITLLRQGLNQASKTKKIHEIKGEFKAIDIAMDGFGEGDLCLILVDQVQEALAYIKQKIATA